MFPTNDARERSDGSSPQTHGVTASTALDARTGPGASLASVDLNLLIAFEALWTERSVTAAGRRLGLSQPATSAALARLREMLGDRLFVRAKNRLEPTERCTHLAGPITKILVDVRNTLAGSSFDPATTTRRVRVGAVDAAIAVWMPRLLARTMREAPRAQIQVVAINPARATEALEDGSLDLALSPLPSPSSTVRSQVLHKFDFVVGVRAGHPLARKRTPAALDTYPRAHVFFEGVQPPAAPVLLGSYLAVPSILAQSDAWALLPRPYAAALVTEGVLAILPAPAALKVPSLTMQLLWPEAQDASPMSLWLRNIILEIIRTT